MVENDQRPEILDMVVVQPNQDDDQVLRQARQNNIVVHDNITNVVERVLVQNGLNMGLYWSNYISQLSGYVRQAELPRGWKVPKFTKFTDNTSESTVEHVARYQTKVGDLANNKNLKIKYFPNSLTKNIFTLFNTLPPNFIFTCGIP